MNLKNTLTMRHLLRTWQLFKTGSEFVWKSVMVHFDCFLRNAFYGSHIEVIGYLNLIIKIFLILI